ncbi:class I SAM-dependent methyltransferase [Actinomycetospora termitidis]|uniref:Class I SAM-dependent methyltransferase n=1 Tax=Actinomycetospora termitidis TaxID=3053470 RepID=A0ABT7MD47_9PSEU|nr:class I SAM-dependent methyltransferase [Actinomycetospora sp. Odt1-22]MDL5158589.1 class I SAM-dependent methyltransferase [Actinomycetospora sp. Odt1-22]
MPESTCRICGGVVTMFLDLGRQPLSDVFPVEAPAPGEEFTYALRVGTCADCTMVQLLDEVPREAMFGEHYPYRSSGSSVMRAHFEALAKSLLAGELSGRSDPFVVEIGSNDGVMLRTIAAEGVRHLGVEPSSGIARTAAEQGVAVLTAFFEVDTARAVRAEHGPADVVYAANTICHIPYLGSILDGVAELLTDDGVFVFEDPYLGDIVAKTSYDQIYDEHFFLFSATTVADAAARHGLELVGVERLPVHGGEVRYTLARAGRRTPDAAVGELLAQEAAADLHSPATLRRFADAVAANAADLVALLERLRAEGARVVAYGATAKSATVTNYAGIGTDLVEAVVDTTPEKQHRVTPGAHLPVRPASTFAEPYPDYALLFAWNHAAEILDREAAFRAAGGRWILYVPDVRVV